MENGSDNKEFRSLLARYERFLTGKGDGYLEADEFAELAEYYMDKGESEAALRIIHQALEILPDALEPLTFMARYCLFDSNDYLSAEKYIERIQDKSDVEYHYVKAEILIVRDGAPTADKYLKDYFKAEVQYEPEEDQCNYNYDVANLFYDYDEYELSMRWLDYQHDENDIDYKRLRARVLFNMEKHKESEAVYNQILNQDPFDVEAWHEIALAQMAQDNISEALTSVDYALAIEPDNEDILYTKAHCLLMLGNFMDATQLFEQLSQEPI